MEKASIDARAKEDKASIDTRAKVEKDSIDTLLKAEKDSIDPRAKMAMLRKMKLYVVRVNERGKYMDSKPCYHCHCQLRSLGVRCVVYSTGEDSKNDFVNMDLRRHCSANVSTGFRYMLQRAAPLETITA